MKNITYAIIILVLATITYSVIQEPEGEPCVEGEDCKLNNLTVQNLNVIGESFNVTFQILILNIMKFAL